MDSPGEVFVHRNIGNQVPGNDLNVLSVLEFAVGHLDIKDIVVTGHYDCGAVRASVVRQDLGTLENWLRLIRDVHRLHKDTLAEITVSCIYILMKVTTTKIGNITDISLHVF